MEKITQAAVTELLEQAQASEHPVVTIYVPMHRQASPPHMTEDQIRIKNLITKAIEQLEHSQPDSKLVKELRHHLDALQADQRFWEKQTESLLICASSGRIRMFNLPIDTEEYVAVDNTFHLTPILGLLHDATEFYVLVVAQHNPRLLKGDMYGIQPSGIELPQTLEATLRLDETPKGEQSVAASGSSMHTSAFNGRGGAHDLSHSDRSRFFRMVDAALVHAEKNGLPLILAGIDDETAAYRTDSRYPHILEGTISGNIDSMSLSPEQLHAKAYAIVQRELIDPQHDQTIARYMQLSGANPDRVANDSPAIEAAAEQGRIDTLLLALSRQTADTVRDDKRQVRRITFPTGQLKDAINKLALKVQGTSGSVVVVDESQMPNKAPMVALLRY